jgi:hypothetical protein
MVPLLPDDDDPVLKTNTPLTPELPALGVINSILPLDDFELKPASNINCPPLPVLLDVAPAINDKPPPVPEFPIPEVR